MFAVIFRSTRTSDHSEMYQKWSEKMEEAVSKQDGYISHFSFRDTETGDGVTISYFDSEESISKWRQDADHREAQLLGQEKFYQHYSVEVVEVKRHYVWSKADK